MELIENDVIRIANLTSLPAGLMAGMEFAARTERYVEKVQVLFETPSAVTLRNVSRDAVGCIDAISSNAA
jgi:hypothetical protein